MNIQDINGFIKKMIRKGFTMEKFGEVYDILRNSKPEPSETIKEHSIAPSIAPFNRYNRKARSNK